MDGCPIALYRAGLEWTRCARRCSLMYNLSTGHLLPLSLFGRMAAVRFAVRQEKSAVRSLFRRGPTLGGSATS